MAEPSSGQKIDTSMYAAAEPPSAMQQLQSTLGMANQAQDLQQKKLNMAVQQQHYVSGMLGALYSKPDLTHKDIIDAGTRAVNLGILTPQQLASEMMGMPTEGPKLRAHIGQQALRVGTLAEQLAAHAGQPMQMNNGANIIQGARNPMTGQVNLAGGGAGVVPMQVSPEGAMQRVSGAPTTTGAPTQVPAMQAAQEAGALTPEGTVNTGRQNRLMPPGVQRSPVPTNRLTGQPEQSAPAATQPPEAAGKSRLETLPDGSQRWTLADGSVQTKPAGGDWSSPQKPTSAAPIAGPQVVGNAPGFEGAVKTYQDDLTSAGALPTRINPLLQAIPKLEALGKTGTGPTTEMFNDLKSAVQSLGIPGIDMEKVKTFDEAKKYLMQYVTQSGGGGGTNEKLVAAFGSSPSVGISNAAAVDVAKAAVAMERMNAAKSLSHDKAKPGEYPESAARWAQEQDARAYGFDLMSKEQKKVLLNKIDGTPDEAKFLKSLKTARSLGLVK